jgi:hypothetical protein
MIYAYAELGIRYSVLSGVLRRFGLDYATDAALSIPDRTA